MGKKNKIAAGLLAFFLGAFGVDKFYLGCKKWGFIILGALAFCLAGLCAGAADPSFGVGAAVFIYLLIGFRNLIDAIRLFTMNETEFDSKYNSGYIAEWQW